MEEKSFSISFLGSSFPSEYIRTKRLASIALEKLIQKDVLLGIDTETMPRSEYQHITNAALSPLLSKIRLLQIFDGETSYVFDMLHIDCDEMFIPFLSTKKFVAHYAKFDLGFFKMMGVQDMNLACTHIVIKLLFHATYPLDSGLHAGLAPVVKLIFKEDILKKLQYSDWSVVSLNFEQIEYAALDAICVLKLAEKLAKGIKKLGLERIYKLTKDAQHPIVDMELNGIGFDVQRHLKVIEPWKEKLWMAKKEVLKLTGLNDITAHKVATWLEENLDETTLAIWPRTETGKLSTDANTFADFNYLPIVKPFSIFQKQYKLSSTYGHTLIGQVCPATKRLHSSYNLCGARTGRLSASKPNLQQLPRDDQSAPVETHIRRSFRSSASHTLICADYSQIEVRVGAHLSNDSEMLRAYREGIDIHTLTAARVSNKALQDVTKDDRQLGKALVFGLMFGLGAKKFSHYALKNYGKEVNHFEAIDAIEIFRETYGGYREWQLNQADIGATRFEVRTPMGKLRKLAIDNTYGTSMNTPIQGGAAECMLASLCFIREAINKRGYKAKLVNCVHDEVLIECPEVEKDDIKELVETEMTRGFLYVLPGAITNGLVSIGTGDSWGAAK